MGYSYIVALGKIWRVVQKKVVMKVFPQKWRRRVGLDTQHAWAKITCPPLITAYSSSHGNATLYSHSLGEVTSPYPLILLTKTLQKQYFNEYHNSLDTFARQMAADHSTQHSQETGIHAAGGIRTHNPSKRAAADLRLRPRGHWDWLLCFLLIMFQGDGNVSFCSQILVASNRLRRALHVNIF